MHSAAAVDAQKLVGIIFGDRELLERPGADFRGDLKLWRHGKSSFQIIVIKETANMVDELLRQVLHWSNLLQIF
jgi:hypothetical protein